MVDDCLGACACMYVYVYVYVYVYAYVYVYVHVSPQIHGNSSGHQWTYIDVTNGKVRVN